MSNVYISSALFLLLSEIEANKGLIISKEKLFTDAITCAQIHTEDTALERLSRCDKANSNYVTNLLLNEKPNICIGEWEKIEHFLITKSAEKLFEDIYEKHPENVLELTSKTIDELYNLLCNKKNKYLKEITYNGN